MCFSATASFVTAAATGAVGIATLARTRQWNEVPLAAIPLTFAVQQAVEGALWLSLGGAKLPVSQVLLANMFAIFALSLWPVYAPVAVGLVETAAWRRRAMVLLFLLGLAVAIYGAKNISDAPYAACIVGHSLSYINGRLYPDIAMAAYVAATCLPALLSSHRALWLFGLLVAGGLAVSVAFFFEAQLSVWCFFAAVGSLAVYAYFAERAPAGGMAPPSSQPL